MRTDGSIVTWGLPDFLPDEPIPALTNVTAIAAGGSFYPRRGYVNRIATVQDGGVVRAWGESADPAARILSGATAIALRGGNIVALLQGVPLLPNLAARLSGNELSLSWPTNSVRFRLQENSTVSADNWSDVLQIPTVSDSRNQVILPPPTGNKFFRLNSSPAVVSQ